MLRKYIPDSSHVSEALPIKLNENLSFEVQLVGIVHQRKKELRNKVIPMVKVLWRTDTIEEIMWKTKASMRSRYPYLFSD